MMKCFLWMVKTPSVWLLIKYEKSSKNGIYVGVLSYSFAPTKVNWSDRKRLIVIKVLDVIDDNSQTVTVGPATDHSRTPSPQKMFTLSQSNPPAPPVSTSSNTNHLSNTMSTTASKEQAPVYTFLPSASIAPPPRPVPPPPPPPSINNIPIQPSTTLPSTAASLTIFAPKPFRSSTSLNLDSNNQSEFVSKLLDLPLLIFWAHY